MTDERRGIDSSASRLFNEAIASLRARRPLQEVIQRVGHERPNHGHLHRAQVGHFTPLSAFSSRARNPA